MKTGKDYRFPTVKPGWSVEFPGDPQLSREIDGLIDVCESSIKDAALCLALFEATQAHRVDPRLPDWAPPSQPLFIYAREFVFALDAIGKSLKVIADETRLVEVRGAVDDFYKAVPTLTAVRDTAHHLEDRARGRGKHKRPLDLRPFTILGVDFGRGLSIGNLYGSSYGGTAGNGEHATVDITAETLEVARRALQRVLDALPWEEGPPRLGSWPRQSRRGRRSAGRKAAEDVRMLNPLWITYAWSDNEEGDFDYLVQELGKAGIAARYDKIALVPGRQLWAQIADRISSDPLSGWAYLVTPSSLASNACREELSYALQRALETRGDEFPLIGLLHGVSIRDVPLALRVRLCVNLANPDWIEETRAGVTGMSPHRTMAAQGDLIVKVHENYLGRVGKVAIEIRPRFGELRYWRLAFPSSGPQPSRWGTGPANGGGIGGVTSDVVTGEYSDIGGTPMKYIGAGNPIGPSSSAYAVFDQRLPERLFFGLAKEPFGTQASGRIIEITA